MKKKDEAPCLMNRRGLPVGKCSESANCDKSCDKPAFTGTRGEKYEVCASRIGCEKMYGKGKPCIFHEDCGNTMEGVEGLICYLCVEEIKNKNKNKKNKKLDKKKKGNTHGKLQLPRKPSQVANRIRFMDKLPSLVKVEAKLILVDLAKT